jgi:colicin import membrane protein
MADKDEEKAEQEKLEAAKKADEQRITDIANRAAADHSKRAAAKFDKALEERDAKIAALTAENEELRKKPAPAADSDPVNSLRKEMDARLKERDAQIEAERKARESEVQKRLAEEERTAVLGALGEVEITGELQKAAFLSLKDGGQVGRNKDGQLIFKTQKDGYVDEQPLREGLKAWAETTTGKAYQAPRGVQGSGNKPAGGAGRSTPKGSRAERVAEAREALSQMFFGGSKG